MVHGQWSVVVVASVRVQVEVVPVSVGVACGVGAVQVLVGAGHRLMLGLIRPHWRIVNVVNGLALQDVSCSSGSLPQGCG
jgi:hypothetical protein